jgi:hypothetical protein
MYCTTSAAWSRPVSSPWYTEHGQRHGAVLSGRITTVAMSRSGQLGMRCIVEPNCSDLSACLACASVTRDRALNTCEPSCVPRAAPELYSRGGEAGATWQHRSPPRQGGEVRS